jgi:hypothetical protein
VTAREFEKRKGFIAPERGIACSGCFIQALPEDLSTRNTSVGILSAYPDATSQYRILSMRVSAHDSASPGFCVTGTDSQQAARLDSILPGCHKYKTTQIASAGRNTSVGILSAYPDATSQYRILSMRVSAHDSAYSRLPGQTASRQPGLIPFYQAVINTKPRR